MVGTAVNLCLFIGCYFCNVSLSVVGVMAIVFFFKQKTAYEMRISDWSSDVGSSDLQPLAGTIEVVSNWYMVGVAFLPLAYVQWHREHLIVELFTQNSSDRKSVV